MAETPTHQKPGFAHLSGISSGTFAENHFRNLLRLVPAGDGDVPIIVELAKRLGLPASNASKHMKVLRDSGLAAVSRAENHTIAPGRLVSKAEGIVDYGTCLLRLGGKS